MSNGIVMEFLGTSTPLGAGGIFQGVAGDTNEFAVIIVTVTANVDSAENGLEILFSSDNSNWHRTDEFTVIGGSIKTFTFQPILKYFNIRYTNGATPQTSFLLQVQFKKYNVKDSSHRLDDNLSGQDDATLVKSVIAGRKPDGQYANGKFTQGEVLEVGINDIQADAGARVRVSQMSTLGDYKVIGSDRLYLLENVGTGTGLYSNNKFEMSVTSGQWYIRRSRRFHSYFSGKSQIIEVTFDNFHTQANLIKRIGYFSSGITSPYDTAYDGFWIEDDGTTKRIIAYRNGTKTIDVPMSQWQNSAIAQDYNWENFSVLLIDFLWLGGAVLRFWLKTNYGFVKLHQIDYAGSAKDVMILSPSQPLRYEIRSTGGSGNLRFICAQISTEGSLSESGSSFSVNTGTTPITFATAGTTYPLKAIRKPVSLRNTVSYIDDIGMYMTSNDAVLWSLQINPTLSSGLTYASAPNTQIETANGNGIITVTSPGILIASGYISNTQSFPSNILKNNFLAYLSGSITGDGDQYVLCITPLTTNVSCFGSISFKDY